MQVKPQDSHDVGDARAGARSSTERALAVALLLNFVYLLVEVSAGLLSGSLALLSDAAHMVSDVAALALAYVASRLASRPPAGRHTFGWARAEVLGAFANAVILLVACLIIFKEAISRLVQGAPNVPGLPVFVVASIGLCINLGSAYMLFRAEGAKGNLNVRGALVHMLADALGSVGAMVSALLMMFAGWAAADAVASLVIGVLVLYGAWGILRDSAHVLLEGAPESQRPEDIHATLLALEGVSGVHDLHVWSLGGAHALVTAHLIVSHGHTTGDVLRRAERHLHEVVGIRHTTLQLECEGEVHCADEVCPLQDRLKLEPRLSLGHAHGGHGHGGGHGGGHGHGGHGGQWH